MVESTYPEDLVCMDFLSREMSGSLSWLSQTILPDTLRPSLHENKQQRPQPDSYLTLLLAIIGFLQITLECNISLWDEQYTVRFASHFESVLQYNVLVLRHNVYLHVLLYICWIQIFFYFGTEASMHRVKHWIYVIHRDTFVLIKVMTYTKS